MRSLTVAAFILWCALLPLACHHAAEVRRTDTPASGEAHPEDSALAADDTTSLGGRYAAPGTLPVWSPRYIKTGASSGIMVEFTGLKKDKPLNARYALIQVWPDSTPASDTSKPHVLLSQINELHQAFFPLSPGRYTVRQVKDWADRSYVHAVIVKEDHYAIVPVDVAGPWKQKQLKETSR